MKALPKKNILRHRGPLVLQQYKTELDVFLKLLQYFRGRYHTTRGKHVECRNSTGYAPAIIQTMVTAWRTPIKMPKKKRRRNTRVPEESLARQGARR